MIDKLLVPLVLIAAQVASPDAAPVVSGSQALGPLVQNAHVVARDNGQSAGYDGRSVWLFDDTILQNPGGFISNTAASTSDLDASDGISLLSDNAFTDASGVPSSFIPVGDAEQAFQAAACSSSDDVYCGMQYAFWPGPVVADPARHRILFSYGKLCRGAADGTPCESGFAGSMIGTGFAQLDMDTRVVTRLPVTDSTPLITSPEGDDPTLMFPPSGTYTGGALLIKDDYLYAWGSSSLARVPVASLQDRTAWRYYDGTSWSSSSADAVSVGLVDGAGGGSVSYVPALGGYLNTYMPGLSNTGMFQTAPEPWGPWSTPQAMFTGLPTNTLWDYAMFGHPEYASNGGLTQYFTYYHPESGQQELVRVDFTG